MNKQIEAVTLALAKIERDATVDALLDEEKQSIAQAVIDSLWTDYVQENESTWPEDNGQQWVVKRTGCSAGEVATLAYWSSVRQEWANIHTNEVIKDVIGYADPAILGGGHETD